MSGFVIEVLKTRDFAIEAGIFMTLSTQQIKHLGLLRVTVGILGEQATPRWWTSSFCSNNGRAFLAPVFPRTYIHAQYQGVVSAAALVHDERIGVGNVFHLFRLPEVIEQALQAITQNAHSLFLSDVMKDVDFAVQFLRENGSSAQKTSQGPIKIGPLQLLRDNLVWKDIAAFYLNAFERQQEIFPFFSDHA